MKDNKFSDYRANDIENDEPRLNKRKKVFCRVDYTKDGKRIDIGVVRDVSGQGMRIEGNVGCKVGDLIKCAFQVEGYNPIKINAEIVRVEGRLYGLKFLDPWQTLRNILVPKKESSINKNLKKNEINEDRKKVS